MEKLWSPWRSNYIESFKEKKEIETCVFCEAKNKNINDDDCLIVFKSNNCYVMMNLYPYNSGHIMVIPYNHVSSLKQLSKNELNEMMEIVSLSMDALELTMKPQGYNFGANLGKAAGAGIDEHIHFHIVPRWNGDTNFMPVLGEVKIISQDLLITKKNLINSFNELIKRNENE
ncbi:MAG: HIT domain-containing protein [Melioribacteraceae bacterium]|nr:HIT domain-containing protein [Melioribacteraceae bacterium]